VTLATAGWIAGRIWIPDDLKKVISWPTFELKEWSAWMGEGWTFLPVADESDTFAFKGNRIVVVSTMQDRAFIFVKSFDLRPLPIVQDSGSNSNIDIVVL
jgi:hypothetical protein